MPTPFTADNQIDIEGFKLLIARQIKYGTSQLFILGSAGEVTLLTLEEKEADRPLRPRVHEGSRRPRSQDHSGLLQRRVPDHRGQRRVRAVLRGRRRRWRCLHRAAVCAHHPARRQDPSGYLHEQREDPCGIYNNPSRLGVQVLPETIQYLAEKHENFVVDKEALPSVEQLVQVQRLCEGKVKIMCCDYPHYSIVIPTLAVGGTGTANIGGNIIPEEAA